MHEIDRVCALIDIEASGLGPDCYPVEIAWGLPDSGSVDSVLIAPPPHWDVQAWDPSAEAIHGLSREALLRDGLPPHLAIARLLDGIRGRHLLYCDGLASDRVWLERLFDAAGRADYRITMRGFGAGPGFRLKDLDELLLAELAPARLETVRQAWRAERAGRHRAASDVRDLLDLSARVRAARGTTGKRRQ